MNKKQGEIQWIKLPRQLHFHSENTGWSKLMVSTSATEEGLQTPSSAYN